MTLWVVPCIGSTRARGPFGPRRGCAGGAIAKRARAESGLDIDVACPIGRRRKGRCGLAGTCTSACGRQHVRLDGGCSPPSTVALPRRSAVHPAASAPTTHSDARPCRIASRACDQDFMDPCRTTAHRAFPSTGPSWLRAERDRSFRPQLQCAPEPPTQFLFTSSHNRRAPRTGRTAPPASRPGPVDRPIGAPRTQKHG
jgi:hypothetical protein